MYICVYVHPVFILLFNFIYESIDNAFLFLLPFLPPPGKWSPQDDETLVQWIETIARQKGVSPLHTNIQDIFVRRIFGHPEKPMSMSAIDIETLFATHTRHDIEIRTILILHMNDLLSPLLPLLSGLYSGDSPTGEGEGWGGKNEPSHLLNDLKHVILLSVVHEFTYKSCRTHGSTSSPIHVPKGSAAHGQASQAEQHSGDSCVCAHLFYLNIYLK